MASPELPEYVRESNWLAARQEEWAKERRISQPDLEHFCGEYIPAIMRGAPSDLGFVYVSVTHFNTRSLVMKTTELACWEFDELPADGLITVVAENMRREARRIGALDEVVLVECEFGRRGGRWHYGKRAATVLS